MHLWQDTLCTACRHAMQLCTLAFKARRFLDQVCRRCVAKSSLAATLKGGNKQDGSGINRSGTW
jgi:hypothetical protein